MCVYGSCKNKLKMGKSVFKSFASLRRNDSAQERKKTSLKLRRASKALSLLGKN